MNTKYLDLLKQAIGNNLHGPAYRPLQKHGRSHVWWGPPMRWAANLLTDVTGLTLCLSPEGGWPEKGDTMISVASLNNIQDSLVAVVAANVPGDYVECGVWRGGSCVFAKAVLNELKSPRKVWGFDSFCGLPKPDKRDPGDKHYTYDPLSVSLEEVKERAKKYGVGYINWVEGFFNKTLPTANVKEIAVLRLDGDMYASTMDILNSLYRKVSPGGIVIIDDYALEGCREAIEDFFKLTYGVWAPTLYPVDRKVGSVRFIKPFTTKNFKRSAK